MEVTVLNSVAQQHSFGVLIVLYFFLAGLSAGLFLFSALARVLNWEKVSPLIRPAGVLAAIVFLPAPLVLIADLATPARFFLLLFNFNPTSVMAWGTWIVTFYGLAVLWYGWKCWQGEAVCSGVSAGGIVMALALATYTGLLIGVVPGRPLWNSGVIPILFLVSGVVSGVAVLTIFVRMLPATAHKDVNEIIKTLGVLKLLLIITEALLIGFHLIVLALASVGAKEAMLNLITGSRHVQFVWIQIVLGLVAPMFIIVLGSKKNTTLTLLSGFLSVIGVYALRLNFVAGGQETALMAGSMPIAETEIWQILAVGVIGIGIVFAGYRLFQQMLGGKVQKAPTMSM